MVVYVRLSFHNGSSWHAILGGHVGAEVASPEGGKLGSRQIQVWKMV